jgi:LacI family transcriptional regulator
MRRGPVTIKEVAAAAGVHASTVSRALNPATRHLISPEIAAKVEAAARELGYARNEIASSLRTRRSMTVGVLVPDITNPLVPPMLRGVEDALGSGYTAIVANTDNDPERGALAARRLLARGVDGLVLATARRRDPLVRELAAEGVPLVLVNRTAERAGDDGVSAVVSDDAHGVRLMVEHLMALGHRRIAHLAGPQDLSTGAWRQRAFKDAVRAKRLEEGPVAAAKAFSIAEGERVAAELLRAAPRPTAILAGNDMLALGACAAAKALGLAVPGDVSVAGFNDTPFVDRVDPPLTTIRVQHRELGAQAAQLLLKQLERPDSPRMTVHLGVTLVPRASTGAVRGNAPAAARASAVPAAG